MDDELEEDKPCPCCGRRPLTFSYEYAAAESEIEMDVAKLEVASFKMRHRTDPKKDKP